MTSKDQNKITNEKPVKIPLDFTDAIAALLKTKPEPKEKKKGKGKKKKTG